MYDYEYELDRKAWDETQVPYILSGSDFGDLFDGRIELTAQGILAKSLPNYLAGSKGIGKTQTAVGLCQVILNEDPEGSVVYFLLEAGAARVTRDKMRKLGILRNPRLYIPSWKRPGGSDYSFSINLERSQGKDLFKEQLKEVPKPISFVVIDTVTGMGPTAATKGDISHVIRWINQLVCVRHGATLLYVDHFKKPPEQMRFDEMSQEHQLAMIMGFSTKLHEAQVVYGMVGDRHDPYSRVMVPLASNIGTLYPIEVALKNDQMEFLKLVPESIELSEEDKAKNLLRRCLAGEAMVDAKVIKDLAEDEGISWAAVKRAKSSMEIESKMVGVGSARVGYWINPRMHNPMGRKGKGGTA